LSAAGSSGGGPNATPVDRVEIAGTPEAIWSILDDPAALGRVLPGCESVEPDGPDRFRLVLVSRVQMMTLRIDAIATFSERRRPSHLRLELAGTARRIGGSVRVVVPFDLAPVDPGRTLVTYAIDLSVTGTLAMAGTRAIRDALRSEIGELVRNVERELAVTSPGTG
jgi:2-furoyl-CoA dehydrogenase large subunit